MRSFLFILPLFLSPLVSAHCKITSAKGDLGGASAGLGITAGSGNSQSDVTIFRSGGFGQTASGKKINPATDIAASQKIAGNTLAQVSTGGTVSMTLHQVNADGAGPMSCSVDATASGNNFQKMTITTNVPGKNGISKASNTDFPLVAQMPAGVACTGTVGGQSNVCAVSCQNPTGPFGGTVLVQQGGAGNGSGAAAGGAGAAAGGAAAGAATEAATGAAAGTGSVAATSANSTTGATGAASAAGTTAKKGRKGKGKKKGKKGAKGTKAKGGAAAAAAGNANAGAAGNANAAGAAGNANAAGNGAANGAAIGAPGAGMGQNMKRSFVGRAAGVRAALGF